jgi:hypothetical protein
MTIYCKSARQATEMVRVSNLPSFQEVRALDSGLTPFVAALQPDRCKAEANVKKA